MNETFFDGRVTLHHGDSRNILRTIADASIDSVVTDPPYALVSIGKRLGKAGAEPAKHGSDGLYARASAGFMGQTWDTGETAFAVEFWAEVLRVLKPGGHLVAFSGTRTYHRMVVAIEDAGFEIRDQIGWLYGSGFPKSHDVSKAIDKALGYERRKVRYAARPASSGTMAGSADTRPWIVKSRESGFHEAASDEAASDEAASDEAASDEAASDEAAEWSGWGTALKPAWEPIVLARKPLVGTVAETVLVHGTGAINVDGCRVESEGGSSARADEPSAASRYADRGSTNFAATPGPRGGSDKGRWPANVIHDGSAEVVAAFPASAGQQGDIRGSEPSAPLDGDVYGHGLGRIPVAARRDGGSAARFFYSAKADAYDRIASKHPTIKPVDLMQWLCRLVTPKGGVVLDPFAGSGTTGEAAWREGFRAMLIEREATFVEDIRRRMRLAASPAERAATAKARGVVAVDYGPLFGASDTPTPPPNGHGDGRSTVTLPIRTSDWPDRTQTVNEER